MVGGLALRFRCCYGVVGILFSDNMFRLWMFTVLKISSRYLQKGIYEKNNNRRENAQFCQVLEILIYIPAERKVGRVAGFRQNFDYILR